MRYCFHKDNPVEFRGNSNRTTVQLINYPQGTDMRDKGILSFVQFKTNDCAYYRFNIPRLIGYEHENAKGSVVTVEFSKEEKWLTINPERLQISFIKRCATNSIK